MTESIDAKVARVMKAADGYAHVYAFVGDDTMPRMRAELEAALRTELAAIAQPAPPTYLHHETERLGAIWTHCTQCGKKWADDEVAPLAPTPQPAVQGEPVAWMIDGGITLRQDWARRLHHSRHRDGTVGIGRAIPDAWIPVLFAGYRASPQGAVATPQPATSAKPAQPEPMNYPGDAAAIKQNGLQRGYCSCVARADDDDHKQGCKFWDMVLEARKMWHERHVAAWSCAMEARGHECCPQWCGSQESCTASTKPEGDAKDAAVQGEPISGYVKYCSISHPEAPHNFNRQASHAAHRYVCTCEGWEPWMEGATEADPMQKLIDTSQEGDAIHNLREAVYAVLSNEDHAFSGGMRSYQKGSQTWQVYEDLRIAAIASQKGAA